MPTVNPSTKLRINSKQSRTIKFYTLGCKVNQYDTQLIREGLLWQGFRELEGREKADIYVINTCTVTHRADAESLGLIRRATRENPCATVIVTGCLAELDKGRIRREKGVSRILGNKDKFKIPGLLGAEKAEQVVSTSFFKGHTRAFIKIQDGCDNRCSYCKVPLVRGGSRSRKPDDIIEEARQLAANGYREIVLTGICLGSFGKDLSPPLELSGLIAELERIGAVKRIRLSSIEARDVNTRLIRMFLGSKKLCRHLHIPIQSGDDGVLRMMNRRYTSAFYLDLIRRIRRVVPDLSITTDCLVGFPGETDRQFKNTVSLVRKIRPLRTHIFPYSPRPRTPAALNLRQTIDPKIIKERCQALSKAAEECAQVFKKESLGTRQEVLFEGRLKQDKAFWEGYTGNYLRVLTRSKKDLKNRLVKVKLEKLKGDFVVGKIASA